MSSGNSYKKLLSTTLILAVGSFSSKILVFLLMPLYTWIFSTKDYGTIDLIQQSSNLLIPLASVGIANSVIRFGLDKSNRKDTVFTTGLVTVACGFAALCCFGPLLQKLDFISGYTILVLLYVLMSALHSVCSQFVQSRQLTKLFAVDGVLRTVMTIVFNLMFLLVFDMGITGYILATIVSDGLSTIFLWFMASLGKFLRFSSLNRQTSLAMLRYSIPLIPTMVCVWIINMSDRFMLKYFFDASVTGIYSVSVRVPTILSIVAGIFGDAWQISIVSEDREKRRKFFSDIFATYQCIALLGASGLIMTAKLVVNLLTSTSTYYSAWQCIPILVLGAVCSCLGTFLSSIYMLEKQSIYTLLTMCLGAGANILLNLWLIPNNVALGAALATFLSYLLMFVVRGIHTRKFIAVKWNLGKFLPSALLLMLQALLMLAEVPQWLLWQLVIFGLLLLINGKELLRSIARFL